MYNFVGFTQQAVCPIEQMEHSQVNMVMVVVGVGAGVGYLERVSVLYVLYHCKFQFQMYINPC